MAVNDAFFDDSVLDGALDILAACTDLYLVPAGTSPGDTEATVDAAALAPSVAPSFTGPAAGTPSGRELEIDTKDFAVDANGTAAAFALTDGSNVLYVQELNATQGVTSGQTWTLPAVTITFPDYDAA